MQVLKSLLSDLSHLFYPNLCLLCEVESPLPDAYFCLGCELNLPYTDHFTHKDNALMKHFWGRCHIDMGAALFSFRQHNEVRKMIHRLKYKNRKDIGISLGKLLGRAYLDSSLFANPDYIIPVPLSDKKHQSRGYNQAQLIAEGVSEVLDIEILTGHLVKIKDTSSQTRKTRLERIANVKDNFRVKNPTYLRDSHLLLIDDVITTGATLESCANVLLGIGGVKVSILTVGVSR